MTKIYRYEVPVSDGCPDCDQTNGHDDFCGYRYGVQ